jgi:phospholipid-binding lipoprotein MlaA
MRNALALCLLLAIGGCATPPTDPQALAAYQEANDPLEPTNRHIFEFNRYLDGLLIKNIALLYKTLLPEQVRTGLRNALINLNEPVVFVNDVLQAQTTRAGKTVVRFAINSTLGIAGIFDWASGWGFPEQTGDFGQTLYSWGVPDGPYLVIPLLGPNNPRDGIGEGVDGYFDPFAYLAREQHWQDMSLARFLAKGIDDRAQNLQQLDEIEKNSIDFYAQIRSLYRQNRAQELAGKVVGPLAAPIDDDLYKDPAKSSGTQPATQ